MGNPKGENRVGEGDVIRVHVPCGTVYLEGYDNIDLPLHGHYLAAERRDLVDKNWTQVEKYYARELSEEFLLGIGENREVVCDRFGRMEDLDYSDESVEEIVCIQGLEHLTADQAEKAMSCWNRILKPGGLVRLSVPDMEEIMRLALAAQGSERDWYYRLIYGSQKGPGAEHREGYDRDKLRGFLARWFVNVDINYANWHSYPTIIATARKLFPDAWPRPQAAKPHWHWTCYHEYRRKIFGDFGIKQGDKVLDIGSGCDPFPLATHLCDISLENNKERDGRPLVRDERPFVAANAENLPFADKEIDFAHCAFLLEHVEHPEKACSEIIRVAKRGYIEVGRMAGDFWHLAGHHHRWYCEVVGKKLVFIPYDLRFREFLWQYRDGDLAKVLWRIVHMPKDAELATISQWFFDHHDKLFIMFPWRGEFEYQVIYP